MKTKMASRSEDLSSGELDHPEILSRERLVEILSQRCLPDSEIQDLEKYELVSLFYKFVSPLPQRTHQLKRTTRMPVETKEGTTRTKRRCQDDHVNPEINNKMSKLDLSWVTLTKYKSRRPSDSSAKANNVSTSSNLNSSNTATQPKVVKLNRRSLGLSTDNSIQHVERKHTLNRTEDRVEEKKISTPVAEENTQDVQAKKKFKRVAVTWP